MSPCSGDPGSYPEDGSGLAPPPLEDTSLHTAIDLKKRTEAASSKMDQVTSYLSCLKTRAVPGIKDRAANDPSVFTILVESWSRGLQYIHVFLRPWC